MFDFSGGINTADEPTSLAENELVDCENLHLLARGGLRKRKGYVSQHGGAAFQTTAVDDFNRANNTQITTGGGALFEVSGDWSILSNQLRHVGAVSEGVALASQASLIKDGFVEVDFQAISAAGSFGILARWEENVKSGYEARVTYDGTTDYDFKIVRWDLGSSIELFVNSNEPLSSGDTVRFELSGSTLLMKINGVTKITVSDPVHTIGHLGLIGGSGPTVDLDNFNASMSAVSPAVQGFGSVTLGDFGIVGEAVVEYYVRGGSLSIRFVDVEFISPGITVPTPWLDFINSDTFLPARDTDIVRVVEFKSNAIFFVGRESRPLVFALNVTQPLNNVVLDGSGGSDTGDRIWAASVGAVHNNSLILGDVIHQPSGGSIERLESRIWPSDPGTLDDFIRPANDPGVIDIDPSHNGHVVGIHSLFGYLVVLKEGGLYRIENYGVAASQIVKKISNVGCAGRMASFIQGVFIIFLDQEGQLWSYDVRGDNEDALQNLSLAKLGKSTLDSFNAGQMFRSCIAENSKERELWTALPEAGETDLTVVWVFNKRTGGWTKMRYPVDWNFMSQSRDKDRAERIYVGDIAANGSEAFLLNSGLQDDGGNISPAPFVTTRPISVNAANQIKGWRGMHIYCDVLTSQTAVLHTFLDFSSTSTTQNVTLPAGTDFVRAQLHKRSRWIQHKIVWAVNQLDATLRGIVLYFMPQGQENVSESD